MHALYNWINSREFVLFFSYFPVIGNLWMTISCMRYIRTHIHTTPCKNAAFFSFYFSIPFHLVEGKSINLFCADGMNCDRFIPKFLQMYRVSHYLLGFQVSVSSCLCEMK
jgi:hypothetical protein